MAYNLGQEFYSSIVQRQREKEKEIIRLYEQNASLSEEQFQRFCDSEELSGRQKVEIWCERMNATYYRTNAE